MPGRAKKYTQWGIVFASLALVFLSPLDEVFESIKDVAPWALIGIAIFEIFWNLGAAIMAMAIGFRVTWSDVFKLKLRKIRNQVLESVTQATGGRYFWFGFWMNIVAAVGDDVIAAIAVIQGLPPQSWGLLLFVVADTAATFGLRHMIIGKFRLS